MIRYLLLLFFVISTTTGSAFAEDKSTGNATSDYCISSKQDIMKDIVKANSCWNDSDCMVVDYGCPWQLGICHKYLSGKDDEKSREKINAKISEYDKKCVQTNAYMKEQCKRYDDTMAVKKCAIKQPLLCVNGECVTQTHVISGDIIDDGVDVYGSRESVVAPPLTGKTNAATDR